MKKDAAAPEKKTGASAPAKKAPAKAEDKDESKNTTKKILAQIHSDQSFQGLW